MRRALQPAPGPRLRAGAVPYLNAWPLTRSLAGHPRMEPLRLAEPSLLAREMAEGRLDLALLPAFAALSRTDLQAADGVGIGSDGPVRSVLLYARRPLGELRTLAPDPASLSSNALARILLAERYGVRPALAPAGEADAVLRIGDAALKPSGGGPWREVMDLGEAWRALTGLPFVYALWAGPSLDREAADVLRGAARRGLESRPALARAAEAELGIVEAEALDYLTRHIRYDLGARERQGLKTFSGLLRTHRLVEDPHEPAWI